VESEPAHSVVRKPKPETFEFLTRRTTTMGTSGIAAKIAIPADSVARAVLYAIEQPADVEIDEVVLRPTAQDF
jgi:NADP-dependent 3-hydroxy acid dehydrogenase YdfG